MELLDLTVLNMEWLQYSGRLIAPHMWHAKFCKRPVLALAKVMSLSPQRVAGWRPASVFVTFGFFLLK